MVRGVQVLELWRYPVKSLQGERVDEVSVSAPGLDGDRRFAIFDARTGFGLTGRRVPELLFASARFRREPRPPSRVYSGFSGSPTLTTPGCATRAPIARHPPRSRLIVRSTSRSRSMPSGC